MRPYTPSSSSPPGMSHEPSRQPACFSGRAFTGIGAPHVLPPSDDFNTYVPSQPMSRYDHVQSPCSSVNGPRDQDGCSGRTPRLKYAAIVKSTSNVPSSSSQMPQSQLPTVSVNGSTTDGADHVAPLSLDRMSTVCPLSWWNGNRSSLNTATRSPERKRRTL